MSSPYQQLTKDQIERAKTYGRIRHPELYQTVGLGTKGRGAYKKDQLNLIWKWHLEVSSGVDSMSPSQLAKSVPGSSVSPTAPFKQPSAQKVKYPSLNHEYHS